MSKRIWSNWNFDTFLVRLQNSEAALENSLAASYKHALSMTDPSIPLLNIYLRSGVTIFCKQSTGTQPSLFM